MRILFTSEISESQKGQLISSGNETEIVPFISTQISFDKDLLLSHVREFNPQVIAMSSKNAFQAMEFTMDLLCDFYTVCVLSDKQAEALSKLGIKPLISEQPNVDNLAEKIHQELPDKRVLHLCGNLRKNELTQILKEKGVEAEYHTVYQTNFLYPKTDVSKFDIVVFNSYSTIDSFYRNYRLAKEQRAITIGPKTTDYLKRFFDGKIYTATSADINTLILDLLQINDND